MTAQNSASKTNFGKYFFYKLKALKMPFVGITFFSLISFPLLGLVSLIFANASIKMHETSTEAINYTDVSNAFHMAGDFLNFSQILCTLGAVTAVLLGIVVILSNFRWLDNKKFIDMDMALPVSTATRFKADFLSGIIIYLLPQIICGIIGNIMISIAVNKLDNAGIELPIDGYGLVIGSSIFILEIIISIMFFCSCLFFLSLCAREREARLLPIGMNILIVEVCVAIFSLGQNYYGTTEVGFSGLICKSILFRAVSPFAMGLSMGALENEYSTFFDLKSIICVVCVSAIYVVATWCIIRKRRNELVGNPFIHPIIKHIVLFIVTLGITAGFGVFFVEKNTIGYAADLSSLFGFFIITSVGAFVVLDFIFGQEAKEIVNTILRYLITVVACIAVCFLIVQTKGFGKENYIPKEDNITAAYINVNSGVFDDYQTNDRYISDGGDITHFDKLIQLHEGILDLHDKNQTGGGRIHITYILADGEEIEREYKDLPNSFIPEALKLAYEGGIFNYKNYGFREKLYVEDDIIGKNVKLDLNCLAGDHYNLLTGEVEHFDYIESNELFGYIRTDIPGEELYEALKKDYANVTFDTIYGKPYRIVTDVKFEYVLKDGPIHFAGSIMYPCYNYYIYSFCENALAVLEKYGQSHTDVTIDTTAIVDGVRIEKRPGDCTTFIDPTAWEYIPFDERNIVEFGEYWDNVESETLYADKSGRHVKRDLDLYHSEIYELLSYCAPQAYVEGYEGQDLYVITLGRKGGTYHYDNFMVVRPEYNDRAAELFNMFIGE